MVQNESNSCLKLRESFLHSQKFNSVNCLTACHLIELELYVPNVFREKAHDIYDIRKGARTHTGGRPSDRCAVPPQLVARDRCRGRCYYRDHCRKGFLKLRTASLESNEVIDEDH